MLFVTGTGAGLIVHGNEFFFFLSFALKTFVSKTVNLVHDLY